MIIRVSHIILSIILLVSTIGLVVSKHYCKTELVAISFFDISDSCCDDGSCCHDESEAYQLKIDFSQNKIQIKVESDQAANFSILLSSTIKELIISNKEQSLEYFSDKYFPLLSPEFFSFNQAYIL